MRLIGAVGAFLGVLPVLVVFTRAELTAALRDAGFTVESEWQPGKGKAVFIIARKPLYRAVRGDASLHPW